MRMFDKDPLSLQFRKQFACSGDICRNISDSPGKLRMFLFHRSVSRQSAQLIIIRQWVLSIDRRHYRYRWYLFKPTRAVTLRAPNTDHLLLFEKFFFCTETVIWDAFILMWNCLRFALSV